MNVNQLGCELTGIRQHVRMDKREVCADESFVSLAESFYRTHRHKGFIEAFFFFFTAKKKHLGTSSPMQVQPSGSLMSLLQSIKL